MENLKLSAIACALMLGSASLYAQSSQNLNKDENPKPAKIMVSKDAVDLVLKGVSDNQAKPQTIALPVEVKPVEVVAESDNKETLKSNEVDVVVEEKVEPIKKSVPIISSDTYISTNDNNGGNNEQVKAEQPKVDQAKDPNRDYELEARIRKLFIVSDFMMETPYEYGGYILLKDNAIDKVCDLKKPDRFYMLSHEGGSVNQLGSDLIAAQSFNNETEDEYYHQWNKDLNTIKDKCVNAVLGPTVDVNFGERSYTQEVKKNLQITLPIVSSIERKGMLPVLKHFPGDMMDCEAKFARKDVRSCPQGIEEINEQWKDFKAENYPAIMVSNHVYEKVSPLPAVMNSEIHSYLRGKLGYRGLVMTDVLWEMSVPITPKTMWEIFKYNDLIMLINPQEAEAMIPYMAMGIKQMPDGIGEQMLRDKEKRLEKAKKLLAQ